MTDTPNSPAPGRDIEAAYNDWTRSLVAPLSWHSVAGAFRAGWRAAERAVVARQEEPAECWRHADGSVRTDHMDTRPGDYFGAARQEEGPWCASCDRGVRVGEDGTSDDF